jgi:hypothetical protein
MNGLLGGRDGTLRKWRCHRHFGSGQSIHGREVSCATPQSINFVKTHDENSKGAQSGIMDAENQRENLESFGKLVLADLELHNRLRAAAVEAFPELAVKLGAERGYTFTVEVVRDELQKKRRALREKWI